MEIRSSLIALGGHHFAQAWRGSRDVRGGSDVGHQPADAVQHVDRRIMPARGQLARQPGVAVEQPANRVADRLVRVVSFDQHRVKAGDAARVPCVRPAPGAWAAWQTPTA